ncbi:MULTISPECIES: SEC-C domain-containing protein [unclassified Bradyrhizobium]|uniref:SEC-C domain-containing protein n=1 Tax=unclassified Bradyrhizobium TaxID=2631580 RepID=UPI00211E2EF4|nr:MULTISPECIES: SEC-C domain-containing protein [unclassified Bradyrhizobium]MDD1537898.1 hypothetical protein [Bradyrhizobium sp. WBOS8]MDD1587391.1 hypothetical protein [Bradyrhizobium sp. WBOS4]UUO45489.1 hypothetical protein DCM78_00120 [Bradyrhizobium sp. WBOS04]UUO59106.1 hypothetical protein DCM80_07855 [Bradyrhizobium sp. WBOS08]
MAKFGRNQPCHCGSGKKYKHCHGSYRGSPDPLPNPLPYFLPPEPDASAEVIRLQQQGKGRPIISFRAANQQIVSVGNDVHWSSKWKTFPDFLLDYIKIKLGPEWAAGELAKSSAEQHPLMQWAHLCYEHQKKTIKNAGEVASAPVTGAVAAYLGTAYALYLLQHNVELQERLLCRLKDIGQFQGAYYELIVASTLIRAGFKLTLEDETDGNNKHCEFAAISSATGKRYWVEAKMRSVAGLLGKSEADGGADDKPLQRLIPHLNDALAKPAADDRLIFIDLNVPTKVIASGNPHWLEPAIRRLERYERLENVAEAKALIFVTNADFHRAPNDFPAMAAAPFGLGFPDFNRSGRIRVTDLYRARRKFVDAFDICTALQHYLVFPTTFDGRLPSDTYGQPTSARVRIGQTYFFPEAGNVTGTVTSVLVQEDKKQAIIAVQTDKGSALLAAPMTNTDLAEWKEFGDAIFGETRKRSGPAKDRYDMFEFFVDAYKKLSRDELLRRCAASDEDLTQLTDEDLLLMYCEAMVASLPEA